MAEAPQGRRPWLRLALVAPGAVSLVLVVGAWLGLVELPRRELPALTVRAAQLRRELSARLARPPIGGAARDCDSRVEALAAARASAPSMDGLGLVDLDSRDIAHPPIPRIGLADLGSPPSRFASLAWAASHRREATAYLDAARCRWAPRALPDGEGWRDTHTARVMTRTALALVRPDPARCVVASVAATRLAQDVAPAEWDEDALNGILGHLAFAEDVGLACAREAPVDAVRAAARDLRALDGASRSYLDSLRARSSWDAQRLLRDATELRRVRIVNTRFYVHSVRDALETSDRWSRLGSLTEAKLVRALRDDDPTRVSSRAIAVAAECRARVRAFALGLEALAAAMEASSETEIAPLAVPTAIDLTDPFDGAPLRARLGRTGTLEIFSIGPDGPGGRDAVLASVER